METLDIKIALDPVNDGAVLKETKLKRKDEGALIIATNGESRIVDAYEAQEILNKLNDIGHGEYMGDSDYIAMMNGDKIINFGTGKCFIGSVIIMKFDGVYRPNIFVMDSPILSLKEDVDASELASDSMKSSLFKYFISHPCAEQIIIIENEVPNLDYAGVNMRRFSKGNGFWKTDPTTYQG